MPPITTKSTSCRTRHESIAFGRNSGGSCDATVAEHEVRGGDHVIHALVGREREHALVQRAVVPVVDRLGIEGQLLTHEIEPARERRDGGRDEVALDARDRGLRGPSPHRELALRQAVAAADGAEQLSRSHLLTISHLISTPELWTSCRKVETDVSHLLWFHR